MKLAVMDKNGPVGIAASPARYGRRARETWEGSSRRQVERGGPDDLIVDLEHSPGSPQRFRVRRQKNTDHREPVLGEIGLEALGVVCLQARGRAAWILRTSCGVIGAVKRLSATTCTRESAGAPHHVPGCVRRPRRGRREHRPCVRQPGRIRRPALRTDRACVCGRARRASARRSPGAFAGNRRWRFRPIESTRNRPGYRSDAQRSRAPRRPLASSGALAEHFKIA